MTTPRILVVTNDFPPRPGGIQTFVYEYVRRLPPDSVVVYTSRWRGWEEFDAGQSFPVVREDTKVLLPTPAVGRRAASLLREHDCDAVWFGAAAPLGLLAPGLRAAGARRIVATTHGHEAGYALLPGPRQMLRRIGGSVDAVTYLGSYTRQRLAAAMGPGARLERLTGAVDVDLFRPDVDGSGVRARHGLGDRPVVVCVSRLMPRKGQDTLIRAWPLVQKAEPEAALLLVGGGPYRRRLEKLAASLGVAVVFTGSVPYDELPAHFAAGDVFAMPCRTRLSGVDVEGLGIVYLEASATGLPVIAGSSGGAPDAVLEGETGFVVDGRSTAAVAQRGLELLGNRPRAEAMGAAGRAWVEAEWQWDAHVDRLVALLR